MEVRVLTNDLGTQSKVAGAATSLGAVMRAAPNSARMLEGIPESDAFVVVLDLNTQGYQVSELVDQLKSLPNPPRAILAFGPHVHEARLAAAAEAGCDEVLSRGEFFMQTQAILQKYFRQEAEPERS